MTYIEAIIMGAFQGFSEFLPISSSGHLAVLQHLFDIKEGNVFVAQMLHLGTLFSIIVVYFSEIKLLIIEFFKMLALLIKREKFRINRYQKFALLVIFATLPTVVIALIFKDFINGLFTNITLVAIAFIVTGFLLWFAQKNYKETKNVKEMNFKDAFIIGTLQGIAIIPGISRSGSTIVAGLFCGLKKNLATEFSFILAIPAVLGAAILGFIDVVKEDITVSFTMQLLLGTLTSFIVGVVSIKILIKLINKGRLSIFSYYLWAIGALLIIISLL